MANLALSIVNGDIKPVVFNNVLASTGAAISSASYDVVDHLTDTVLSSGNPATVSGTTVYTSNITWNTNGEFVVRLHINYSDGTVDNTVYCLITVNPQPI